MPIPPPRLRRIVLLLLLDRSRRSVLLSGGRRLTPPSFTVACGQSYHYAAARAAELRWGLPLLQIAPVVCHVWATPPGRPGGVRTERRLLMASVRQPDLLRLLKKPPARTQWRPLDSLRQRDSPTEPVDLAAIIEGYWDGWLPDGPLTVDWH
ncbi:hypothetical protein AB0F20_17235 [Streptomyces goshikiensis]|uniref:hypothetical protein n=1 Tax=Streptomyces goshikiensis TaxID=1942 RepID=UPI0033E80536